MRHSPERLLITAMGVFAVVGGVATALDDSESGSVTVVPVTTPAQTSVVAPTDAAAWFESIRQHCNPVEVETRLRWQPPPASPEGHMHEAACYALAGKIDRAREAIEALPEARRYEAAGVVFEAGHPAADAGDDIAAGPLMELVVEFWPNHYMALYHAGAARYESGSYDAARRYLERFLGEYATEDGWRSSAKSMLEEMARQ